MLGDLSPKSSLLDAYLTKVKDNIAEIYKQTNICKLQVFGEHVEKCKNWKNVKTAARLTDKL